MKLGLISAGFVAPFQAVAVHPVCGLEIARILKRRGAEALARTLQSRFSASVRSAELESHAWIRRGRRGNIGARGNEQRWDFGHAQALLGAVWRVGFG